MDPQLTQFVKALGVDQGLGQEKAVDAARRGASNDIDDKARALEPGLAGNFKSLGPWRCAFLI